MAIKPPPMPEFDVPITDPPSGRLTVVWWEWLQRFLRWDEETSGGGGGGGGGVASVSGTPPVVVSGTALLLDEDHPVAETTVAGDVTVSMPAANASTNGYLTSGNWTTFNGKEPPITAGTTSQWWRGDKSWQTLPATSWGSISGVPATFPPAAHVHPESEVTNLVTDLAAKAPLASPAFTGNPTAPTPTAGDNDTSIATTAFVTGAITTAGTGYAPASHTHTASQVTDFSEAVDDRVGALLVAGSNVTLNYNDAAGSLTINAAGGGTPLTDGDKGDIVVSASGATWLFDSSVVTAAAKTVLDDASVGAMRTTLGAVNIAGDTMTGPLKVTGTLDVSDTAAFGMQLSANATDAYIVGTAATSYIQYIRSSGWWKVIVNNVECFRVQNSGNIVALTKGYQPGGGSWADSSDARIKNIVGDYSAGLAEILQLQPRRFTYRGNDTADDPHADKATVAPFKSSPHFEAANKGTEYIGLIAQETEVAMPEMVKAVNGWIDGDEVSDLRELDTTALAYCLVNAIKELAAMNEALEARVAALEGIG
jgi:hypothetical protein